MASVRTVDFLPEIFQTPANRQFLAGTLDQLVQEPNFSTTQGYIGRRIGPGVNANDDYVVEPTVERANYQLEPGVVITSADKVEALDAITYPGILNALELQGAQTSQASRLFSSDYYCWDPFIDLDKMVNFAEYYWLPAGPFAVTVQGSQIPYERNINVTRNAGSYSFDFQSNQPNPTITLVRGGSYQFIVNQNITSTFTFRVSNRGSNAYVIDYETNPTLTLIRGNTYQFVLNLGGDFPFYIKTQPSLGTTNLYSNGVVNNGAVEGQVTFTVPYDAPDTLYYAASTSEGMRGTFNVVDATAGFGPKFWIQTERGIDGVLAGNPNISSRDVLGVENNGIDSGVVTFNVPQKTAQNFYYDLTQLPNVDIVSDIQFADINHVYVNGFFEAYPNGIDGVVNLENRTIVFVDQSPMSDLEDAYYYGWYRTQFYNPVPPSTGVNEPGTYDVDGFSTDTPILAKEDRYQVYQIQIETGLDGAQYFNLVPVLAVPIYTKFYVSSGETNSNTQWYKNSDGFFEKIPLLSAALDVLFYQDSVNPSIYGEIRLIEQTQDATIFIDDIVGKKYYTSPNGVVFTNGLKVQFQGSVLPESYVNQSYYVEGVGIAIKLLPVLEFITPETYTENTTLPFDSVPYDIGNYDVDANQPILQDYLTLNRASSDRNAWSRSNRWFHRSVIEATALYTQTTALLDQEQRAKRPILEFRAGMQLFDFGTKAKTPINVIDFTTKDAFSQVAGTTQYNIDGYQLTDGSRIIFAADTNPDVRNKVYTVTFISPDTEPPLISQPIIALTLASDADALLNETLVCINGITLQGVSFWFDGITWQRAQQKTKTNQSPLFNIYDRQGFALSDNLRYAGSSFAGSPLFSYAQGTGANDLVLNFPLQYLTISNVGDIVFDNNLYTETFLYVVNRSSVETPISIGVARQYFDRTTYEDLIGWQPAVTQSHQYQQFRFAYNGQPLLLDIAIIPVPVVDSNDTPPPNLKVYVGSKFLSPDLYEVTVTSNTTSVRLLETYAPDDVIEVLAFSDQLSEVGFYQIPTNLENNPFNTNSSNFTLGTIRTHYESIGENLVKLIGPINGSNNSRDLGNILPYGETILQQSSPLTLSGLFLRQPEYNVFSALTFNSLEYVKYKNLLLDTLARNDYSNLTTAQILTSAISEITLGKTDTYPFYWSDMLPAGAVFTENNYTYTAISTPIFETTQVYDFTSSNYLGLNVYVNNRLLTRGYEFVTIVDAPSLEILIPLSVGDVVTIQEFESTYGSFCPNTPTKMGLYPSWVPQIYEDTSYITPTTIILGHDGSKTVAFGDFRDAVLLEFETRIFNNLKITSPIPIEPWEVIPGQFRTTDYTSDEIQNIFDQEFLSWIGWNKLDYTNQEFRAKNQFTYNYSQSGNKLTGTPLPGAWRGIYLYFYDTVTPNTTPWEMLGFAQKPTWWDQRYGPAPYTSGNLVLWDDLEAGRVADPAGYYIKPEFARPGLTQILPVSPTGELLSPFDSIMGAYDPTSFKANWKTGDYGPVEYSWRASSSFPFAVMRLIALTRTAEFFSLFADRDLYKFDDTLQQYLYNKRYRLDANGIEVYGLGTSKASFINWIVDYNAYLGNLQAPNTLTTALKSLDVRLCYRMAGFTNKQYLKIFLEKPSPASVNTSLLLPDSSVDLLLYKNQPFDETNYSSVIVQKDINGYQVFGYNTARPYFQILESRPSGKLQTVSGGGTSVKVPAQYTDTVVRIPYGYKFVNATVLVDFLLSYGEFLTRRGLTFTTVENGKTMSWHQMAVEFLYWTNQGWGPGNLINLNPSASELQVNRAGAVVDNIVALSPENQIQDQNKQLFSTQNLIIERLNNSFSARSQNTQTISFVNLRFTSYEHILIFRNISVFGDLLYQPTTGARQNRVRLFGTVTNEWNGQLNAQGFILNQDNIEEWLPNKKYTKGEIVKFKNNYWSALTIVQPKENFDFNDWAASDREKIQIGLLPNIPNKANQLANSYNVNRANLESDNDLLSYGLIGFRPRQYMAALDLDDVSQVNVYRQFVGDKGTIQSVTLLSNANFNKESADYKVYENWAILSGIYGAQANRSYIDFRLNEALLTANPSIIQLVEPRETSIADQIFELNQVWSVSYPLTQANFLPVYTANYNDTALPSAGYVNLDDVDITVFSIDEPDSLDQNLNNIGVGTVLWVAKTNSYEWNVYRGSKVNGYILQVTDNLDGTSVVSYSAQHGLAIGDIVVIKFFDELINGVYRVLGLPSLTTITIQFSFNNANQIVAVGEGISLRLQTMRVAQASDSVNLPYANEIRSGGLIWVDNSGDNRWEVIQKNTPIQSLTSLSPIDPDASDTRYGQSIAQRSDNLAVLVGQPDQLYEHGSVINYPSAGLGDYGNGFSLNFRNARDVRNYGTSVSIGDLTYGSAGAPTSFGNVGYASVLRFDPASGSFFETQLLLALDTPGPAEFGTAVAMSSDERWLYVGAPANNAVYAYGRVDVQTQVKTYTVVTGQFSFSTTGIQYDQGSQLTVVYDGQRLTLGYHYTVQVASGLVIFTFLPIVGSTVVIQRSVTAQLDTQSFFNLSPDVTSGIGVDATFNFNLVRGAYVAFVSNAGSTYSIGETLTFYGTQFGGLNPLNNAVVTIDDVDNAGAIKSFTVTGSFIPASGLQNVFNISDYIYSASGFDSVTVIVNGVLQRPKIDYEIINADSSLPDSSQLDQDLVFVNIPPVGATINIEGASYFKFVDKISYPGTDALARFGSSLACSTDGRQVIIGAANETVSGSDRAGAVYVFDRHVERFQVFNTGITTYTTNAPLVYPTSVYRNNQLLQSTEFYNNGQYTSGTTSVTFLTPLLVGDILEIETNQFQLVQKLTSDQLEDRALFGFSVDMCSFNCSVYAGSPDYSGVKPQAGAVERFGNQARIYGIIKSTVQSPTLTIGNTLRVNNYEIAVPNVAADLRLTALATAITSTVPNVVASVTNGYLTISVLNYDASTPGNRLNVAPGYIGSLYTTLGFNCFVWSQFIESPYPQDYAKFGYAVDVDTTSTVLSIGAPNGTLVVPMTFDNNETTFDAGSTDFFDFTLNTGIVYTYDFLPAANESITNPGKFIFGQEIYDSSLNVSDNFGTSIDYRNSVMIVGSPGKEKPDSTIDMFGRIAVFNNPSNLPAWQIIDIQKPAVDVNLLNSVSMYDRLISTTNQFFDFFNPLQGKILGAAQRNIDFVGAIDPAIYNVGVTTTYGNTWFAENLGKIWWDVSQIRFINPYTGDIEYTAKRWGQVFPGSRADVYQWIESTVPPADYVGPGEVYSLTNYCVSAKLSSQGIIENIYYYWVRNLTTVATFAEKTLSTAVIARYIEDPRSSGISYIAPVAPNAVAIYNGGDYIKASDTILHIEFDQTPNDAVVHTQYDLIPEGKEDGFLNPSLYAKMVDSFSGINAVGQPVPDPNLPLAMRYGVQFRPRQSMFVDRLSAGSNFVSFCNRIFQQYPVTEYNLSFNLLNSAQPQPSSLSGEWNAKVANLEQLSWQNIQIDPVGYKYLVESDADNFGFWTIYEVIQKSEALPKTLLLVKVQNYDTKQFWSYADWYAADYNQTDLPIFTVPIYSDLATVTVPLGSTVRVSANSQNKWEIYRRIATGWDRVALQNGTIQISVGLFDYAEGRIGFDAEVFDTQYFDYSPEQETRKIVEAVNQDLFIDDLAIYRNELLTLIFNYILSEQESPNWLSKTSLIDVTHRIRQLLPFQSYRRDNQDFVLDYIKEVKPYHVQIRQFNLQYSGNDLFQGDLTDFDLPAFYDRNLLIPQYVSPILNLNGEFDNNVSAFAPNDQVWQTWPYNQWIDNYLLYLDDIIIEHGGSGYIFPPTVTITGTATRLGTATVTINSAGEIAGVNIIDPGEGYLTTPVIVLNGGSGSGALLAPIMVHQAVRTVNVSLKYDRYEYNQTFVPWQPNDTYDNGTLVSYDNRIWEANSPDSTGVNTAEFDPVDWILMPAGELSGVDRTMGYYKATPSIPGKVLPLLITGVEYPGVQVKGVPFDAATGFDSDPYDLYPYENIQNTPEGGVSYSDEIINSIITSSFLDTYLGTRPSDINIEGGAFVDTYSSYAPEELVPGAEFDTLDLRVYTRPGADWELDGHGFAVSNIRFEYDGVDNVFSFANLVEYPITVEVTNITQRYDLVIGVDFTVDYINQTVTISTAPPVAAGDTFMVRALELGGGNQLYRTFYNGSDLPVHQTVIVPVSFAEIQELAVFYDGVSTTNFEYNEAAPGLTAVNLFGNLAGVYISLTVLGVSPGDVTRSWSTAQYQIFTITDNSDVSYVLENYYGGTNPDNMIVLKNGVEVRPPQGVEYFIDGSSTDYALPTRGFDSQEFIADPDVHVYVDGQPLNLGSQYTVSPWTGTETRFVTLNTSPPIGSRVLIAVGTYANYFLSDNQLVFRINSTFSLAVGDVICITTWNDTSQQNLITKLWRGPVQIGSGIVEPFDSTPYSSGVDFNAPGSFDYSASTISYVNNFDLERVGVDATRLWVYINGRRLVNGIGFSVEQQETTSYLILPSVINTNDVVTVIMPTDSIVPEAMAFRIFQDMRETQLVYRMTPNSTTTLAAPLSADADIAYLNDVSVLGTPDLIKNIWGVCTVNAERIMFRYINTDNNTISGLMRGTAGTGAADHANDSIVYDMSEGNMLPMPYQNFVILSSTISTGTTNTFTAEDINLQIDDSTDMSAALRVIVGGRTLVSTEYTVTLNDPATVVLQTIPPAGVEVTLAVLRGESWYQPGINTPSNGRPLQLTNTIPARFLRGL